ncbi:hypothetical protein B0I10_11839 [Flavobacterium lacus]|uniref:Uncharacterized protein n=1 Tax=Flavobacterium lacus TaxID=1353778 RepID=A0A328WRN9_9FLAO|nr:hypothetical protein B0I10_11839 [Flavobacterium lacus]
MFVTNKLDWKTYESITKHIYETLGKQPATPYYP